MQLKCEREQGVKRCKEKTPTRLRPTEPEPERQAKAFRSSRRSSGTGTAIVVQSLKPKAKLKAYEQKKSRAEQKQNSMEQSAKHAHTISFTLTQTLRTAYNIIGQYIYSTTLQQLHQYQFLFINPLPQPHGLLTSSSVSSFQAHFHHPLPNLSLASHLLLQDLLHIHHDNIPLPT